MKSPLNTVLGLGSAGKGTSHWWQQKVTAVALVPLGLWFAISLICVDISSHSALLEWISQPLSAILLCLTAGCLIYHSWLGISVVVEDYVAGAPKVITLLLSSLAHGFLFAVCLFSVLKISFGAV